MKCRSTGKSLHGPFNQRCLTTTEGRSGTEGSRAAKAICPWSPGHPLRHQASIQPLNVGDSEAMPAASAVAGRFPLLLQLSNPGGIEGQTSLASRSGISAPMAKPRIALVVSFRHRFDHHLVFF